MPSSRPEPEERPLSAARRLLPAALVLLVCGLSPIRWPATAEAPPVRRTFAGECFGAIDGDTLTVIDGAAAVRVRLAGVDAPEPRQAGGSRSRQALEELVAGQTVRIDVVAEQPGGILGRVHAGGTDVAAELVRRGLAYRSASRGSYPHLAALEGEAERARRGVWADAAARRPWDYRAEQAASRSRVLAASLRSIGQRRSAVAGLREPPAAAPEPAASARPKPAAGAGHWLNTDSQVRHNAGCRFFGATAMGRTCEVTEGTACRKCGG